VAVYSYGPARIGILRDEIPIGVTFGISGFLLSLRANIDLLALSAIAPAALVGAYGLARRIVSIALVTGASLDRIVYSRLAVAGQKGPAETFKLAQRYVVYAVILTGATSIGLSFILAPGLPLIFGDRFEDAIGILKVLSWTLILTGIQNIGFDALNAANRHKLQVTISGAAVLIGASTVLALTLRYGIQGTYLGVYFSETISAIFLWAGLIIVSNGRNGGINPSHSK
jgi:O-antigen/teichoic acid export membrane protein